MKLFANASYNKEYFRKYRYNEKYRELITRKCKCGHSVNIFRKEGYEICSFCGKLVFLSKKHEFKYNMKRRNIC